ncbi:MAG: hypothetical protein P8Y53_06510 [Pseudolabrys sp.]
MTRGSDEKSGKSGGGDPRQQRLAAALRANLRRRKAQARGRPPGPGENPAPEGDNDGGTGPAAGGNEENSR